MRLWQEIVGLVFLLAVASLMFDVWGKEFTIWAWMSGNWGVQ